MKIVRQIMLPVFILTLCLNAQTGTIAGKVFDEATKEPLPGANVMIEGTAIGAAMNAEGNFQFSSLHRGVYKIKVTLMGYTTKVIVGVQVVIDDTTFLEIALTPTAIEGELVVVTADKIATRKDRPENKNTVDSEKNSERYFHLDSSTPDGSGIADESPLSEEDAGSDIEGKGESEDDSAPDSPVRKESKSQRSTAGLRAGFADDNHQFNYFVQFLEKYKKEADCYAIPIQERIKLQVRDGQGHTLPNAQVKVYNNKKMLAQGKTYSDGSFLFFPSEYGKSFKDYQFKIQYNQTASEMDFKRQGKRIIEVALPTNKSDIQQVPLDILFILDTTGSMGEEINRLKKTIEIINLNLMSITSKPKVRFGMVLYRDKEDDYVTQIIPFTDNLESFQQNLNNVEAKGGGDGPEDLQSALKDAIQSVQWNEDGVRLGFIITDAPPHLDYKQEYTYVQAALDAKSQGIKLFSVGTGGLPLQGEYVLRQISQYTSAKYIFLTYGEEGESEGGRPGSVSHHTGDNFTTDKLESIIIRIAKEEIGLFTDTPLDESDDYFEASKIDDENREETLRKLFKMALDQLIDYSSINLPKSAKTAFLSIGTSESTHQVDAEYFSQQCLLSISQDDHFKLIERKDLQAILSELKLSQSGLIKDSEAVRAGELMGVEFLILGDLFLKKSDFEVFLKLIRVESAEVLSVTKMKIDSALGIGD